jgi:LytS/YehU family sensor histidine kinase
MGVSLLELTPYLHAANIPGWVLPALLLPSALAAFAFFQIWHVWGGFARIDLDRPALWMLKSLCVLPLLALGEVLLVEGGRLTLFAAERAAYQHLPWPGLIAYETGKSFLFYALWLCLAFGAKTLLAWQKQSLNLMESQKALAESQLGQLRAQLQPHFLFNSLNTISALMQTDVPRADRLIARLADLLRSNLRLSDRSLVPLSEELHFLELYAGVMVERFGDRVRLHWAIAEEAKAVLVPALLLQPLLENAFRHGVERVSGSQSIDITIGRREARLDIVIRNSGGPFRDGAKDGIGLSNCRRRLAAHYGEAASMSLSGRAEGGARMHLSLPWQTVTG